MNRGPSQQLWRGCPLKPEEITRARAACLAAAVPAPLKTQPGAWVATQTLTNAKEGVSRPSSNQWDKEEYYGTRPAGFKTVCIDSSPDPALSPLCFHTIHYGHPNQEIQ